MIYARLHSNLSYFFKLIMYVVKLDGQTIVETHNEVVAWASYRATLKRGDLVKDRHVVSLLDNDVELHSLQVTNKSVNTDIGISISNNDIVKLVTDKFNFSPKDVKQMLADVGLTISNSKANGWFLASDSRKYQRVHDDELYLFIQSSLKRLNTEVGYTPVNYRALVEKTGLSNAAFMREFAVSESTFYANSADIDNKRHSSMSYKAWLELNKKVNDFLLKTS